MFFTDLSTPVPLGGLIGEGENKKKGTVMKLEDNIEIYPGKQHFIPGFNFEHFRKRYKGLSFVSQRSFIESLDISTNQDWIQLKRGFLGASTASEFLSDSTKVSALRRTADFKKMTLKEKRCKLAEIPLEERLGDTCKRLAYRVLAERRTSWECQEVNWSEKTSVKRGLCFEELSTDIYKKAYDIKDDEIFDVMFVRNGDLLGFSPDKIITKDGKRVSLEIKNFEPPHFYEAICNFEYEKVIKQAQLQIFCGKLDYVDIMLYCAEENVYKIFRYYSGIDYQDAISLRYEEFNEFLKIIEARIKTEAVEINF